MIRPAMPSPVAEYLLRLDRCLWGIPPWRRDEILGDVHEFLADHLEADEGAAHAGFSGLVRTFGAPETMGRHFRFAEWKDRLLQGGGILLAPLAALLWMVFMGFVMGAEIPSPSYLTFLADFPSLLLVVAVVRVGWRQAPVRRRLLLAILTGLCTGMAFCHEMDGGRGLEMLEHGCYGAFLAVVLERASDATSLQRGLLDIGAFLVVMQLSYMANTWRAEPMIYGCLAYHLVNALGIELLVWGAFRGFRNLSRVDFFLAPEPWGPGGIE